LTISFEVRAATALARSIPARWNKSSSRRSPITEVNGHITAGDLVMPPKVSLVTPVDDIVAKVAPKVAEEVAAVALAEPAEQPTEPEGTAEQADAVPEAS
jgi:hypothetical protein